MAELAVGAVLAFAQLVSPFLSNLNLKNNVSNEVESMKRWLRTMKAFMEDKYDDGEKSRRLEDMVDQVRGIAYEIEDVLDEILLHSTHVFHDGTFTQKVYKAGHNIKHGLPLREISEKKMAQIMRKIKDIELQTNVFGNGSSSSKPALIRVGHRVSPLLLDDEIVGYNNLNQNFVTRLMDREKMLVTLAVVGPVGSGKTTFVKNVFWKPKVRGWFDAHAWIRVSKIFDEREVLIGMLKQFCDWRKESYDTLESVDVLNKLREYLETKRYLVVLDDIWKQQHWNFIKDAFPSGILGSRIIVTTRDSTVASSCASSPRLVYNLNGLQVAEAWSLFCKIAFKNNNGECHAELKSYANKIVKRCEGMPLAIVAVGGALAQKPNLPIVWERFHKSLGLEIDSSNPQLSVISTTLFSSYMDLSTDLKCCFLYFSLFPEDYSIEHGRLIRLWVAEQFVMGSDSKTAEEVAEDNLNELIHLNLVHVSNWDFDGRPRNCRVLNLVLTFIIRKCKEENFASIFPQENTSATHKIRRLSVHGDCSHLPQDIDLAVVRSMFLFRCSIPSPSRMGNNFRDFKYLKVLDFQSAPLTEFPEQITCLTLLRYLSLRCTNIKKIPKSIKKLFYLETLDLKQTDVRELPKGISQLHKLRHIFAYKYDVENFVTFESVKGVKFSKGIGNLTNLQKLSLVKVGKRDSVLGGLKQLIQLRKLGLMGLLEEHGVALCAAVEHLKNLTTLDLCSNTKEQFLEVGSIRNPSPSIQKLYLKGRLKAFPSWISSLDNLLRIELKWSKLEQCPLKAIQYLPNLLEIQLVDSYVGSKLVFEASTFKKLKLLLIENFSMLNMVVIEAGVMPELQKMFLRRCPNLMLPPLGLDKLEKVEEVVLHEMPEEFVARLRKDGEDREMIQLIPVIHSYTLNHQSWSFENLSGNFSA